MGGSKVSQRLKSRNSPGGGFIGSGLAALSSSTDSVDLIPAKLTGVTPLEDKNHNLGKSCSEFSSRLLSVARDLGRRHRPLQPGNNLGAQSH